MAPRVPVAPPEREFVLPPLMRRVEAAGWEAFDAFRPATYPGHISFFRSSVQRASMGNPLPAWRRVATGGVTVETVPGSHGNIVAEPNVRVLAKLVSAQLAASASGQRSRHT
jgi:acetoacetyl-CoA synthetase